MQPGCKQSCFYNVLAANFYHKMLIRTTLIFFFLYICFAPKMLHAQADAAKIPKNSVYIEAGGKGQLYSLNYERQIYKLKNAKGGLAVAGAYLGAFGAWYTSLEHNVYIGNNIHNFELGAGYNYLSYTDINNVSEKTYINGRIGYRYQPQKKGLLVRISYTPLYFTKSSKVVNWVGLTFGYAF
jgi:hypothetical protein